MLAAFALFSGAVAWKAAALVDRGPLFNWDVLGYVACAYSLEDSDIEAVHKKTYDSVRQGVSKRTWRALTTGTSYRRKNFEDPSVFAQQLPFYRNRVLYIGSIYLLEKVGVEPAMASAYVSLGAYVLVAFILFGWTVRRMPPWLALPVALGLAFSGPLISVARLSTPDALCALFVATGLFILVELQRPRLGVLLCMAAIFVRPDVVVFALPLCVALGLFAGPHRGLSLPWAFSLGAATVVSFMVLEHASGARPWWVVFHFAMVSITPNVNSIPAGFELDTYLKAVRGGLAGWGNWFYPHVVLGGLAAWAASVGSRWRRLSSETVVLGVLVFACVVRFLLFPRMWDRLFAPYFVSMELVLVSVLASLAKRRSASDGTQARNSAIEMPIEPVLPSAPGKMSSSDLDS